MISKSAKKLLTATLLSVPLALGMGSLVFAQSAKAEPVHVRGAVDDFSGDKLTINTREGQTVEVALAEGWMISAVARASIADIKPGDYVGIASLPTKEGGDGALEVVIFPPALKGANEGSFSWDLKPNSTMTNATVADAVKGVDGRTVTVSYHGKEKKIAIPEGTPVVTLAPADKADLKPGAAVFVAAEKQSNGAISSQRVVVGTDGVIPPM